MALSLQRWRTLAPSDRERLAVAVTDVVLRGKDGFRYAGMKSFSGPAGAHSAPVWVDETLSMWWVLILSGEFHPGYSARKRDLLCEQARLMSGDAEEVEAPREEDIVPYSSWGGWSPDRLKQRAPVRVSPFLISVLPVLQSTPGVEALIDPRALRLLQFDRHRHRPLALRANEIASVHEHHSWAVPSTAECEWAARAGAEVLFPWGDSLPVWMHCTDGGMRELMRLAGQDGGSEKPDWSRYPDAIEKVFDARFPLAYRTQEPAWARANGFGLVDANVASAWCMENGALHWTGGAAECFPWQGCCEWACFLTAAFVRFTQDGKTQQGTSHPFRPVIRIDDVAAVEVLRHAAALGLDR